DLWNGTVIARVQVAIKGVRKKADWTEPVPVAACPATGIIWAPAHRPMLAGDLKMNHVVLLGDSIFDNARYVPDRPPVIQHVLAALPTRGKASLLAVDGPI